MTPIRPDSDLSTTPLAAGDEVAFSTRTPGPSRRRIAAVGGAAVALAVGVVATSFAAAPAPSAPSTSGSMTATSGGLDFAPFLALEPGLEGVVLDHGRFGGQGFRDITITAISGSNVTLATDDGWTRTIALSSAVELSKGGQTITRADLKVGDQVRFRQTRNDDGTYTVEALAVVVPSVRGTVSDVSSSRFKVTGRGGAVWTISVTAATEYHFGTGEGSLADVTNGATVVVQGTSTGDNALTALTVRVKPDRAVGTVTSKTTDSITITQRDGSTVTVHVDAETTYRVAGADGDTDTLADVAVDMAIGVSGRERADGSIDADAVVAGTGRGFLRGGGRGGFDGPALAPGNLEFPDLEEEVFAG